ncbi:hypothetical protein ACJIZ3_013275 [Penstemon smallii]|uniref:Uncharacterized protein n=1 Tax=Penstemon smallii TaxID=265156 RepID=A0ABD3USA9_9LAMI
MEKRQLNFNAPLLSVRRIQSPSNSSELVKREMTEKPPSRLQSLPVNKSDWEYEPTKPATVPFNWEQIPGKPKSEAQSPARTPVELSNTPRIPPGRLYNSGEITKAGFTSRYNSGEITKMGFASRFNSGERSNDRNLYKPQIEAFSFSDHASLLEKLNESLKCKEDESSSETEEDSYSDALDTLSPTETRSLNYSVSGLSGYNSGVKPSGTFTIDTQTRDFMMNRFLPAAKAVALETPKHVVKKPTRVNEQLKELKKVVSLEKKPLLKQYSSAALPYYSKYVDNVESEDEDEESNVRVKKSGKAWGIIPRFCVKNSLRLLKPLPGMKLLTRPPTPTPSTEIRRLTRNAHSGPLDKNACHVPHKIKFNSGLLTRDIQKMENKLTNDPYKSGVSSLRCTRSGNISPYRNESPKSPFREGAGFLGVPKEVEQYNDSKIASSRKLFKALQDVSKNQINERGSGPPGDAVEKILYVDSQNNTDVPISKTSPTKALFKADKVLPSVGIEDIKPSDQESSDVKRDERNQEIRKSPLAPPLPRSPSESWLWKTLPSISLGNPFSHSRSRSHLHSKKEGTNGLTTDAKWETIVKTSNLRHDRVRYSEELTPKISYRHKESSSKINPMKG